MRIDLVPIESLERASEAVAEAWRFDGGGLRVHPGLGPALVEVSLTLAQIFSHKRSIAVVKGNTPIWDAVLPWFLKESYQVQATTVGALQSREDRESWVQGLKKETVFVLVAEDHPVTGALFAADEIERLCNEKKIFVIKISHSAFVRDSREILPMTVRLCSISENLAVSVSGSRVKLSALFSQRMSWPLDRLVAEVKGRLCQTESMTSIQAMEGNLPAFRFFKRGEPRLYDRAVLLFPDVSGETLLRRLGRALSAVGEIDSGSAGPFGSLMDTTNLCRWNSTRLLKSWWESPPSDDEIRGLVVFSPNCTEHKDFAKILMATYEGLRGEQSW